jgi:hypothetical protein
MCKKLSTCSALITNYPQTVFFLESNFWSQRQLAEKQRQWRILKFYSSFRASVRYKSAFKNKKGKIVKIRSIRAKLATAVSLFLLTVMVVSFQNFVMPTSNHALDIISSFDPQLGLVIREADSRYIKYSEGLKNCTSRTAELELEHKTLKMNLLRVSTTRNQSLFSYAPDLIVSESISNQLKSVINRIGRKQMHMVGMYEPQGRSTAPVVVNVSGNGTSDLILSSYERVNWVVNDPKKLIGKVYLTSYLPSQVVGLPPDRIEHIDFLSSPYEKAMAQFSLDEFMKRKTFNGSCDDYLLASFQGSYSGSIKTPYNVLVNSPLPPTPIPSLGTLQVFIGESLQTVLPGLPEPAALSQCQYYSASNPERSLRCLWNAKVIYERMVAPPKLALFTVQEDGRLIISQQALEGVAHDVCKSKISNSPNHTFTCIWNGKIFVSYTPPPTPLPPPPPAPVYGQLQLLVGKTIVRTILSMTEPEAVSMCKRFVGQGPQTELNCTWNGKPILIPIPPIGPAPYPPVVPPPNPPRPPVVINPPMPPPVPSRDLGSLNYYLDSTLLLSTKMTESEASDYCKGKSISNPRSIVMCLWNGKRIF